MSLYSSTLYIEDVKFVANLDLPWERLQDKKMMLSGATGLIGSFLTDVIMERNITCDMNCFVYALGRNEERFKSRFLNFQNEEHLVFIRCDITQPLVCNEIDTIDYVLHLASNTHPMLYSTDPIGTILTNIMGVRNMLDFAAEHYAARFAFASSNEVYGENRGDVELFDEEYCGYINCNTVRAGYPESKRCGEALCQAYREQKGLNIVIPRFTRTYGSTMLMSDTKAISQFIKKGIAGEDIVLKSLGKQYYSFSYVSDAVSALLTILLCGENGEAYNISDEKSDVTLFDLAHTIAEITQRKVVFEVPDVVEAAGYSTATKARLNGNKLQQLGWKAKYDIRTGLERTIRILETQ